MSWHTLGGQDVSHIITLGCSYLEFPNSTDVQPLFCMICLQQSGALKDGCIHAPRQLNPSCVINPSLLAFMTLVPSAGQTSSHLIPFLSIMKHGLILATQPVFHTLDCVGQACCIRLREVRKSGHPAAVSIELRYQFAEGENFWRSLERICSGGVGTCRFLAWKVEFRVTIS